MASTADAALKRPKKGRRSLREQKRDLYRTAILDAAERVFADHGYDEAKVQQIAAEAQLSLTTLYGVFDSKYDIYRGIFRRRLSALLMHAREVPVHELGPIGALVAGVRMHLRFLMAHPNYLRMQLKEGNAWPTLELLRSPEQVAALREGVALVVDVIRRGIAEGFLIDDDPELMARTSIAVQQVRLAMWIERGMKDEPDDVADRAVVQLLRSYCRAEHWPQILQAHGLVQKAECA